MDLPGVDSSASEKTMRELLDSLEIVNHGDLPALEQRIPDEPYRLNFIALAEKLAPDGKDIRTVGFTSVNGRDQRTVTLRVPRDVIRERIQKSSRRKAVKAPEHEVQIRGRLLEADAMQELEGLINVVDARGTAYRITVPRGMMSDIVKPMFEEDVVVSAIDRGSRIDLVTIDLAEAEEKPE